MRILNEQEALYIACQMEAGAVQLYQRALFLMEQLGRCQEPLYQSLMQMHTDESEHLCQFRSLYGGLDASVERELELAAIAEGLLFEGGMMGASRQGLLKDVDSMMKLASDAEAASAARYREFAACAQSPDAKNALLMIAAQEDKHLRDLTARANA